MVWNQPSKVASKVGEYKLARFSSFYIGTGKRNEVSIGELFCLALQQFVSTTSAFTWVHILFK